ncbi:unnamed protein product [Oikopleura dioica]|uniref:Uncharacterized protein n=1 Tax=Oikopleura dioica TaxID=34765 RepID=E4X244_OIKDI|nr:unnamed protein product [Oikopleura dioica]CBY38467.1 unnamed protein product [Oikopleura dioica]
MKLFAFFAAAIAQELANGTDSRMYGAEESQGSAVDGCGGPNCVAMVESILQSTAELHAAQEAATIGHQAEREADQEEQQQLQANFEAAMEALRLEFELELSYWQGNNTLMNERHQQDWTDFGEDWTAINARWSEVDWSS